MRPSARKLAALSVTGIGLIWSPQPTGVYAGPLNPPSGVVAPTGRFGPRIEISAANTPGDISATFVISQSGSYYLAGDMTGEAAKHGIRIDASDVTIDLMGFTVRGVPISASGIRGIGGTRNIRITNGIVRNWGQDGVHLPGESSIVDNVISSSNGVVGIFAESSATIDRCMSSHNGSTGFAVVFNGVIRGSNAYMNGSDGFQMQTDGLVVDCASRENGDDGFELGNGCTVIGCSSRQNVDDGYSFNAAGVVADSTAFQNGDVGFFLNIGGSATDCAASSNTTGISVNSASTVRRCTCDGNSIGINVGASENSIESNSCTGGAIGLNILGADSDVRDNRVLDNADNYAIAPGNQLELLLCEIPETIDWPANVTLAGTLTGVSGSDGIRITSDNVTIDLAGHSLIGVPSSLSGITIATTQQHLTVKDGTIRDWGSNGVAARSSNGSRVLGVVTEANGLDGFRIGGGGIAKGCIARSNGEDGFDTNIGALITDCTARNNGGNGFNLASRSTISASIATNNLNGIRLGANECRVTHNHCAGNTSIGILAVAGTSSHHIESNTVTVNSFFGMKIDGVRCFIAQNTAGNNGGNFAIAAGNAFGPIVAAAGGGDLALVVDADHPWANFAY